LVRDTVFGQIRGEPVERDPEQVVKATLHVTRKKDSLCRIEGREGNAKNQLKGKEMAPTGEGDTVKGC